MLLVADDPRASVKAYRVKVGELNERGAWIESASPDALPRTPALFLILFEGRETVTFHCNVLESADGRILVEPPWKVTREQSQIPPSTGRSDYRVTSRFPAEIQVDGKKRQVPIFCHLTDLSQGGMGLEVPAGSSFGAGQALVVRLVSWDYPVRMQADVVRYWEVDGVGRLALVFPENISELNRELVTQFILDAQRKQALEKIVDV